jgi:tetratricopeptide (TPR) repeat protein
MPAAGAARVTLTAGNESAYRQEAALVFAERSSGKRGGPATGPTPRRGSIVEDGRHLAKRTKAAIGTIVMLIGFLSIITSKNLRHWVQGHPYPVFIAFVAASLAALIAVNDASLSRARYRELAQATEKISAIKETSPGAYALLCLLSSFADAPVDMGLLQTVDVPDLTGEFRRVLADPDYLTQAADELSGMSLAEIDLSRRRIRLRRTAQIFTSGQLWLEDPEMALVLKRQAQRLLADSDPGTPDRDDTEEAYWRSRQHLIATGANRSPDRAVRQLIINQLRRLYRAGAHAEGAALGETSLRHWQAAPGGGNDHQTLSLAVEYCSLMWRTGRSKEAMQLNLQTLGRLRSRFGADDPIYLLCARNRGIDLALLGEYPMALANDQALLSSYERVFGPDHLETLQLHNNTAISLRCLGRYDEALRHDQDTYSARRRILGVEDTSTLTSRFAMARDLRMLGEVQRAHKILGEINLALGRKLTVSPQFRLLVAADLAVSLRRCGYYREGVIQAEKVLHLYEREFGPDYRDALRTGINAIHDFRIAGRLRDARELGERIVARLTAIAGAGHPNTLAARAALACVLRADGDPQGSLRINRDVVAQFTAIFGEAHPSTMAVLTNLATDLAMTGDTEQARQVGERSYQLHADTRGPDHPFTLATAENLCIDLLSLGDQEAAAVLHARTQRTCDVKLGVGHPESRMITEYRRMTLDIEPMMD